MRLALKEAIDLEYEARVMELSGMRCLQNSTNRKLRLMVSLGYYGIPSYGSLLVLSTLRFAVSRLGEKSTIEGILAFFDYQVFGLTHSAGVPERERKIADVIDEVRREIDYIITERGTS